MNNVDFKEDIWQQIEERNKVYNKFSQLIKLYTEVCESKKTLEKSILNYKDEIEKVKHENHLLLTNLDLGSHNGQSSDAQTAALQRKCNKLQNELTEAFRVQSDQKQQIFELNSQYQSTERQMVEKRKRLLEKESETNKLKKQVASLQRKETELKQANQSLKDENKALKIAEKSCRDILFECQRNNKHTAQTWMKLENLDKSNKRKKDESPSNSTTTTTSFSRPSTSNDCVKDNCSEFINEFLDHPHVENVLVAQCSSMHSSPSPRKGRDCYESYFVKDNSGNVIARFKPHATNSLEPDGIVPGIGYLSETAASIVDSCLNLNIVPKTKVVHLISASLERKIIDRDSAHVMHYATSEFPCDKKYSQKGLTRRVGFMQTFVNGYENAAYLIEINRYPSEHNKEYQFQFEKLVVLDYIICNTGRRKENWLIKFDKFHCHENESDHDELWASQPRRVNIKALGNNHAFPFKHPEPQKSYPYQWCELPEAQRPFSNEIKDLVLEKLSNINFIEELSLKLYELFSRSRLFDPNLFEKQLSVMRGQILNLCHAMKDDMSPVQLVEMPPVVVEKRSDLSVVNGHRDVFSQTFAKLERKNM